MPEHLLDLRHLHRSRWPASSRSPASGRRTRSSPAAAAGLGATAYHAMLVIGLHRRVHDRGLHDPGCIYLTFFGEYRARHRHPPHESARGIMTVPLCILGRWRHRRRLRQPARTLALGLPDGAALRFEHYVEPTGATSRRIEPPRVQLRHRAGLLRSCWPCIGLALRLGTSRATAARTASPSATGWPRAGYRVLENKYYFDWLYTDVIVRAHQGPHRPRPPTGSTRTSSTASSTAPANVVQGRGQLRLHHIDQGVVERHRQRLGRRRRGQRPGPAPASRPAGAAVRRPALRRRRRPRRRLHHRHLGSQDQTETMDNDFLNDWGLTPHGVPAAGGRRR